MKDVTVFMKTVGMITFHSACNYGAILQTTALYHSLKHILNVSPVVVDYTPLSIKIADFVRFFPVSFNLREVLTGLLTFDARKRKINEFRTYSNEYMVKTVKFRSKRNLYKSYPNVDVHLCGSDQIWNPQLTLGVCAPLFLDYAAKSTSIKASYSASFGLSNLPRFTNKRIAQLLSKLDKISVREKSGQDIVNGLIGRHAECTVDPTLLLSDKEWDNYITEPRISKPYILVFKMQNNSKIYETARILKRLTDLPIIEVSRYGFKHYGIDVSFADVGPSEFLGFIKNAEYVCTNSYHGILFSLIYDRPCFFHSGSRWNERGQHVMTLVEQKDKIITDQIVNASNCMDYCVKISEEARQRLEEEKQHSINYLHRVLEG